MFMTSVKVAFLTQLNEVCYWEAVAAKERLTGGLCIVCAMTG